MKLRNVMDDTEATIEQCGDRLVDLWDDIPERDRWSLSYEYFDRRNRVKGIREKITEDELDLYDDTNILNLCIMCAFVGGIVTYVVMQLL